MTGIRLTHIGRPTVVIDPEGWPISPTTSRCERVLGEALSGRFADVVVITKFGYAARTVPRSEA